MSSRTGDLCIKEKADTPEKKEWHQVGVIRASRAMNQNRDFQAVTSQKNLSYVNWSPDVALRRFNDGNATGTSRGRKGVDILRR
jgi:hypothetical protein